MTKRVSVLIVKTEDGFKATVKGGFFSKHEFVGETFDSVMQKLEKALKREFGEAP